MYKQNELAKLLDIVSEYSKNIFKDKLDSVILYGSYARGDYDEESDIDIMILVKTPKEQLGSFSNQLDELCGKLLYDYGIVVSLISSDVDTYYRYMNILPFYRNINREGIRIA